jgi:hypothetical protein
MADRNTYALLSARVYDASTDVNKIFVPTGWTELPELVDNGLSGLYARAYRNDATGEIVIAFRGTDTTLSEGTLQDWETNISLGLGIPDGQVVQAMEFYESIKATYGSNVSFTGHSLGGGIASLMAVFFDKQATVFDEAPFQLTAINPITVAAYGALAPSAILDPDFIEYQLNPLTLGLIFDTREENVTNYYLEGEAVDIIRTDINTIVGDGDDIIYDLGLSTAGAIDRHNIFVLTAAHYSKGFLNALQKLPNLLTQLLDEDLYAADRTTNKQDILSLLLRHQFGDGTTVLADHMLDGFARDLNQLTPGGLIKDAPGLEDALITALMQGYDKLGIDNQPFTTDFYQGATGGFYFDINRIAPSFSQIRTANELVTAIQTYHGLDPTVALDGFDRWYLQAGTIPLVARDTEGKDDLMIGGGLSDTLQGGAGDDLLLGGLGIDIYQYRPNDGNDTIIDQDKKGVIVYDPDSTAQALVVGLRKEADPAGQYQSIDGTIVYQISGADLSITTPGGSITVKDFNRSNYDLNIRLLDVADPTTFSFTDTAALPTDNNKSYLDQPGLPIRVGLVDTGDGADMIFMGSGGDHVIAGVASNSQYGDSDLVDAGTGNDLIEGGDDGDLLFGGKGDDWILGEGGGDVLYGDDGNDALVGVAGGVRRPKFLNLIVRPEPVYRLAA